MITLHDLDTAIAKCQGEENPNAQTCIKLAAFYTIKKEMFGDGAPIDPPAPDRGYSASAGPVNQQPETYVDFDSGTEFSRAIDGKMLMRSGRSWTNCYLSYKRPTRACLMV